MKIKRLIMFEHSGSDNIEILYQKLSILVGVESSIFLRGNMLQALLNYIGWKRFVKIILARLFQRSRFTNKKYALNNRKIKGGIAEYVRRHLKLRKYSQVIGRKPVLLLNYIYWRLCCVLLKSIVSEISTETLIIIPDEAYSIPSLIQYNCNENVTWLCNVNSDTLAFNTFKYADPI